jgi:hypothetical protein
MSILEEIRRFVFRLKTFAQIDSTAVVNNSVVGEPVYVTDTQALYMFNGTAFVKVFRPHVVSTTTNLTIDGKHDFVLVDTTSGAVTLTLPTAVTTNSQKQLLTIIDIGNNALVNNITLTPAGAETINGAGTYVINTNRGRVSIISNGANWFIAHV